MGILKTLQIISLLIAGILLWIPFEEGLLKIIATVIIAINIAMESIANFFK